MKTGLGTMKKLRVLFSIGWIACFLLLSGCITVEPLSYLDNENSSDKILAGSTFEVVSPFPIFSSSRTEHLIHEIGQTGTELRADFNSGKKLEDGLIQAISQNLRQKGLYQIENEPDYLVMFAVSSSYESIDGFNKNLVILRIEITESSSGEVVFDRTGRFQLNDELKGDSITTVTDMVLDTCKTGRKLKQNQEMAQAY